MKTFRQRVSAHLVNILAVLTAALCLAVTFSPHLSHADGLRLEPDKVKHLAASAALGVAAATQIEDPVKAWGAAMVPGLLKELRDGSVKGGTGFSLADLAANAIGAWLGVKGSGWILRREFVGYTWRM